MRKFFENIYVIITQSIILIVSIILYILTSDYQFIIPIIASSFTTIATLLFKITKPKNTKSKKSNQIKIKGNKNVVIQNSNGYTSVNN